jgi:hypothetical protein
MIKNCYVDELAQLGLLIYIFVLPKHLPPFRRAMGV